MGKTSGNKTTISLASLRRKKPRPPGDQPAGPRYYYRAEMAQQSLTQLAADQHFWGQVLASRGLGAALSARLTALFPADWEVSDNQRQELNKALQSLKPVDYQQLYWATAARRSAYFQQFLQQPPAGTDPIHMNRLFDFFQQVTIELNGYQQLDPEQRSSKIKNSRGELAERRIALAARIGELDADQHGDKQQLRRLRSGEHFYRGLQATFDHFAVNDLHTAPTSDLQHFSAGIRAVSDQDYLPSALDHWRQAELQALIAALQS